MMHGREKSDSAIRAHRGLGKPETFDFLALPSSVNATAVGCSLSKG